MDKDNSSDEILTEQSPEKIKALSVSGGFATVVSQIFRTILQTLSVILIARYFLSPEDFGFFGIIFALLNFFYIFRDGGLTVSSIQTKTLTNLQINTLFWINFFTGICLTVFSIITSYVLYFIYSNNKILITGLILSPTFIFSGISTQTRALVQRQLRFVAFNVVETISVVLAVSFSLLLAWKTNHPAALAAFHLVFEVSLCIGLWIISGWKIKFIWDFSKSKHLVSMGGDLTFYQFLIYLQMKSDNLIIGFFAGISELGFYERAYQILLVPLEQFIYPLSRIIHSSLSRLQDKPEHFNRHLLRWIPISASISMPMVACLYGVIDVLIPFLLGSKWTETAVLYKALAIGAFFLAFDKSWLFIPLGRIRRQLILNGISTFLFVVGFLIGVRYGAYGVALAYSISRALLFIPTLIFSCYKTPVDWKDILKTLKYPVFASLTALGLLILAQIYYFNNAQNFYSLIRDIFSYGVLYILIWIILPNGFNHLKNNIEIIRKVVLNNDREVG